jgi:hypothetical protein
MRCPLDLIFDNENQRCEWVLPELRMSSPLRTAAGSAVMNRILMKKMNSEERLPVTQQPTISVRNVTLTH